MNLLFTSPWLTIQDVPSSGRVHRFMGWKTLREGSSIVYDARTLKIEKDLNDRKNIEKLEM